jgi:hypothetical protein
MKEIDLRELGDVSRECSLQLLKNFSKLGISAWNSQDRVARGATGSAQFLRYHPLTTTFRTLPDAPRHFQAALKAGLLTSQQSQALSRRLLEFCRKKFAIYSGRFSAELDRQLGQMVRRASDLYDHGLLDNDRHFLPDDLYAVMPWPCRPKKHFNGDLGPIAVTANLITASKQPLIALSVGIDAVSVGPTAGLSAEHIHAILDILEGKSSYLPSGVSTANTLSKIALPSIVGGFQGLGIANFMNLADGHQQRVSNYVHQYTETIGQKCEELRRGEAEAILRRYDNLLDVARAFLIILPPTETIVVSKAKEVVGLELQREKDYWAGYEPIAKDKLSTRALDGETESFIATINGDRFQVRVNLVEDLQSLDPVLTRLRMKSTMRGITSSLDQSYSVPTIKRNELATIHDNLERQIAENVKSRSAAKVLYLIEAVLKHYQDGEVRVHNEGCRKFMEEKLSEPASGYQVTGKSAGGYQRLVRKLVEEKLQFETPAGAVLRVKWRPALEANF